MRHLTSDELPLVAFLIETAGLSQNPASLLVEPMDDGGMGSLAFSPISLSRSFGRTAAECMFSDQDGVSVSAALNLDQHGEPLELDMLKADFGALKQWPSRDVLLEEDWMKGRP
jgi:hypothetical protein